MRLSQRRFLTTGSAGEHAPWRVPVILRYPVAGSVRTRRVWLTKAETVVDLDVPTIPEWIEPNAGASGYYRWSVDPATLTKLAALSAKSSGYKGTGGATKRGR